MRSITISFFKAHLSEELRKVRKGARLVVSDRETPIAEVVPYAAENGSTISVQSPRKAPFSAPRSTLLIDHDPVEYLLAERASR